MGLKKRYEATSFFKDLQTRPFELQVWFVVTAIAGLRALKAVVQDLTGSINPTGLVIDILILLIFCGLCLLIYLKKIPRIPLIVGVMLLILLAFSYVQFGGVLGTTEYNMMGLGVLFALAYNRKKLVLMMTLYIVVIVLANLDLRTDGWLTRSFFKRISTGVDNYLTTLFTLLVIILYFKKALIWESDRITELGNKLAGQIKTIEIQKKELYEQKQLLHNINARLEQDIRNHSDQIVRQNNAMKDYIWLSTESLQIPLKRLSSNVCDLNENSLLETKLKEQINEFNVVVHNLTSELALHQNTDKSYGDHSAL
jgi:hypothetical protein